MRGKVKFAIVGAGVISSSHAKAIRQHPDSEIVAIADFQEEKAKKLAKDFAVLSTYQDYEVMFHNEDIDIVSVCVPSGLHGEVAIAAAQSGIHVLCEKPLDINSEKMSEMIHICKSNKVKLGCVYQRRTLDAAILTRQAIREGKLGKLVLGDAYLKYYRSPEYYKSAGWRGTWKFDGGGALMNQGIHGVDLIQWIMGDVQSVFAYSAPLAKDIEVEDTAVAVLKYQNGAFGVIQGATSVYPGMKTRFEIHGENGTVIFGDNGIQQWDLNNCSEGFPPLEEKTSNPKGLNHGHYMFIDDMIHAVRRNRDPLVPGEEARKAVDLIHAIYESSRTGKEVSLVNDLPISK